MSEVCVRVLGDDIEENYTLCGRPPRETIDVEQFGVFKGELCLDCERQLQASSTLFDMSIILAIGGIIQLVIALIWGTDIIWWGVSIFALGVYLKQVGVLLYHIHLSNKRQEVNRKNT